MRLHCGALRLATVGFAACAALGGEAASVEEATAALRQAVRFFHEQVASHGGYVWRVSGDLALREGEGRATDTMLWVQPPGTPAVGEAFLDAYDATRDRLYLDAALAAGRALVKGQLSTGGWFYHVELDPEKRLAYAYRDVPQRRKQHTKTTLDDDTTQSAVRFLVRLARTSGLKDTPFRRAAAFALESILRAQRPNGGWYMWWDRWPTPASADDYPVLEASYPEAWPRQWPNDWTGRYFINDHIAADTIRTLLAAWETYRDERYLAAAKRGGDFLLLAQMPEPQPAWAQQYDVAMHPVWDRKFEPPAISGYESQGVIAVLLLLYRKTGEGRYLEPVPRALAYLRRSRLPDGRLARFYELRTNRPLFFKRTGKRYDLTYRSDDLPSHYGFLIDSALDELEAEYRRLRDADPADLAKLEPRKPVPSAAEVEHLIGSMDARGAWVERGRLRAHGKIEPASGVIESATFVRNVQALCRYIAARGGEPR